MKRCRINSELRSILKSLSLVVFIFIICDISNRVLCNYSFSHIQEGTERYYRHGFQVHKPHSRLVILGASRAAHHYNPIIMSDSLGVSVYNYGVDGENIMFQYLCLLNALQYNELKCVVLDITPEQISGEWNNRLTEMKHFYWNNDEAKKCVIDVEDYQSRIRLLSSFIQFNGTILGTIKGLFKAHNSGATNGFQPLPYTGAQYKYDPHSEIVNKFEADSLSIKYLDMIVDICQVKGIQLIVSISPILSDNMVFVSYLSQYTTNRGVVLSDNSFVQGINDDLSLFQDASHLNEKGADCFTSLFCGKIKYISSN